VADDEDGVTDFERIIDRRGTGSSKWEKYAGTDILPMWVADMDFAAPPAIVAAIRRRADHGVFGYNVPPPGLLDLICARFRDRYRLPVDPEDIVFGPGVVPALNQACRGLVRHDAAAVTVVPVYHPFLSAPGHFGRGLHRVRWHPGDDGWRFPVDALRRACETHPEISLLLLCNPHNPVGRALSREELRGVVEICLEHDIVICSDEIHCDLMLDGREHVSTASVHPDAPAITLTMMAASKTFNVAGIGGCVTVITNPDLRARFTAAGEGVMAHMNTFAYTALDAAWRDCEPWRLDLLAQLARNRDYLFERVARMPGITMNSVEATYLAWLDVRQLGLASPLSFFEQAGVGMSPGDQFDGAGYLRFNFGCPPAMLADACDRMERALISPR